MTGSTDEDSTAIGPPRSRDADRRNLHLSLFIPLAASVGGAAVSLPALAPVAVPTIAGLALLLLLLRYCRCQFGDSDMLARWTFGVFVLHLAVGLGMWALFGFLEPDGILYDATAKAIVYHWAHGGTPATLLPGKSGFFLMLAALYRTLGPHTTALIAVNAAFSAGIVPLMWDLTARLFGSETARRVPLLLVLVPGFIIWSSEPLPRGDDPVWNRGRSSRRHPALRGAAYRRCRHVCRGPRCNLRIETWNGLDGGDKSGNRPGYRAPGQTPQPNAASLHSRRWRCSL